jgi:hypothetical protein
MGCLFVVFAAFFPRVFSVLLWIARPQYFDAVFGGAWLWPVLGILFLPFTTLMYLLMWTPAGLTGWDWLWLGIAVLLDLSHWTSSGYTNRHRMPGYAGAAPATPPAASAS